MLLSALVAESTFDQILRDLYPSELKGVQNSKNYVSGGKNLLVTAEATTERILEIARQNVAGIGKEDSLPTMDRLHITGHSEARDRWGPERLGTICFWTKNEEEKF